MGDVMGTDRDSQKPQEEEGAAGDGAAREESQSKCPGLDQLGRSGTQPRTGASGAGRRNRQAAPWTGKSGGPRSHEEAKARTGSFEEEQEGTQVGTLDWSNRRATERRHERGLDDRHWSGSSWASGITIEDRTKPSVKRAKNRDGCKSRAGAARAERHTTPGLDRRISQRRERSGAAHKHGMHRKRDPEGGAKREHGAKQTKRDAMSGTS